MARVTTTRVPDQPGVLHIELSRPEKLNAFDDAMWGAVAAAFNGARDDPKCRAVLLSGQGRHFTCGLDLSGGSGGMMQVGDSGDGAREAVCPPSPLPPPPPKPLTRHRS